MLVGWRERVRLGIGEREDAMWERVRSWPLPVRDVLAGVTVALAIACVAIPALVGGADFRHNAELVETQPREPATLVEIVHGSRGEDTYYIQFHGEELEADYGWFIDDPEPGMTVEVVRDPENPTHVVAVGTPQDWVDEPWITVIVWVAGLGLGLSGAVFAGIKFLPERADPVFEKIFDATDRFDIGGRFVRWVDRTLQRWFGGGAPPTGRHASE